MKRPVFAVMTSEKLSPWITLTSPENPWRLVVLDGDEMTPMVAAWRGVIDLLVLDRARPRFDPIEALSPRSTVILEEDLADYPFGGDGLSGEATDAAFFGAQVRRRMEVAWVGQAADMSLGVPTHGPGLQRTDASLQPSLGVEVGREDSSVVALFIAMGRGDVPLHFSPGSPGLLPPEPFTIQRGDEVLYGVLYDALCAKPRLFEAPDIAVLLGCPWREGATWSDLLRACPRELAERIISLYVSNRG